MNKKIIMPVALLTLLSLAVFVSATMTSKTANENKYSISISLKQGWNLVYGIYPPQQIEQESEIKKQDIKAVYFYTPFENKYIEIYPNLDQPSLANYDDEYVFSSSMWIYSEKEGTLTYDSIVFSDYPSLKTTQLTTGWNFIAITQEVDGKSLNDIKGNCNVEKAFLWDAQQQQWGTIFNLLDDKGILRNEGQIGGGFIIKVSSNCKLGASESVPQVPNLP